MSDDIKSFEIRNEEYKKLVDEKIAAIAEILALSKYGPDMADPDKVPEARMHLIIADLYAAQEALFSAGPRNILILMNSGLISEDDGKKLFVVSKMLEVKAAEALANAMEVLEKEAKKEGTLKPSLTLVKGGKDTVH